MDARKVYSSSSSSSSSRRCILIRSIKTVRTQIEIIRHYIIITELPHQRRARTKLMIITTGASDATTDHRLPEQYHLGFGDWRSWL